jgi:hypothetical protein
MQDTITLFPQGPHVGGVRRRRETTTPDAAPVEALESRVHTVRDTMFELADAARACLPHDSTQLHVSLQLISNELGQVERLLRDVRIAAAPELAVARA